MLRNLKKPNSQNQNKNTNPIPLSFFLIKRKPTSKPKAAKYFTKTASDSLIGFVELKENQIQKQNQQSTLQKRPQIPLSVLWN